MTRTPSRPPAPRPARSPHAPVAFLVGLVLLAVSILLLGAMAADGDTTALPLGQEAVRNGTYTRSFLVPPYAPQHSVLEVEFAFPEAPGDAYLLTCADLARLHAGEDPLDPLVVRRDVRSGTLTRSMADYLGYGTVAFRTGGEGAADGTCIGAFVAFRWVAEATGANRPHVTMQVREVPLDSVPAALLFALAVLGAVLALGGGLAWVRDRPPAAPAPHEGDGAGTAETLFLLTRRTEAWLARARRYVLLSGALGCLLWYPVLLPWAWRTGRDASAAPWMPWALTLGALLLLVGLSALWAREFLRIDRELAAWRKRVADLRRREEAFLAELAD